MEVHPVKYKHLFFDLDHTLWDFETNSRAVLAELHAELAAPFLPEVAGELLTAPTEFRATERFSCNGPERIAITGMSLVNALGRSPAEIWSASLALRNGVVAVPAAKWDHERYFDSRPMVSGKTYCRAAAFHDMLQTSQYLMTYVPELYTYLHDFPHGHLANVESFIYWSKELYGLKPVLNLYHVIIYTRQHADDKADVFIISKQIYANHYFESSFSFTAFVDEVGGDTSAAYLMYLNRSRFDQLRGQLKNMIVAVAKNNVYNGVKKYFRQVKERLEAEQVAVITPK